MTDPRNGLASNAWPGVNRALCDYVDAVDGADFDRLADLLEHATVVLPTGSITGGGGHPGGLPAGAAGA